MVEKMKKITWFLSILALLIVGCVSVEKEEKVVSSVDSEAAAAAAREVVEKAGPAVQVADTSGTKLYLVGDSTVCSFNDPYFYPRFGYGTKLGDYLKDIEVINLALSGRSSKSFLVEENYEVLLKSIKKGDFLLIGFGHNDEKTEVARYTNPNESIKKDTSFKYSLYKNYISIAKEKGAIPILCTPIVRRSPSNTYVGSVIHQTSSVEGFPGGDYAEAIRQLGKETKTTVIDLTNITKTLYEEIGLDGSLNMHAWLGHKKDSVDNTHLNEYGASVIAYTIVTEIQKSSNDLKLFVKEGIQKPDFSMLKSNPNYQIPLYESLTEADRSIFWQTTGKWRGTVFGDCGGAEKINPEKGIFSIVENNSGVTLRSGIPTENISAGKISSSTDGIAFYFQQISSKADFKISAVAEIKGIASNNQVSFGLMVRDDVYLDKYDNTIKTDYVACGPLKIASGPGGWQSTFERRSGVLNGILATTMEVPAVGQKISLSIVKKGTEYTLTYGNEAPVVFNNPLAEMDAEYVFAGLYTSRCCEIEFTNISVEIK